MKAVDDSPPTTVAVPPQAFRRGALRSKLVSKLTGLSVPTLQHWHASALQLATKEPGERGTPRLYSWVDYQRLCVIAKLRDGDVPTVRIRQAVLFLDEMFPKWWRLSLEPYDGKIGGSQARLHILVRESFDVLIDVAGAQTTFRRMMESEAGELHEAMKTAVAEVQHLGPLFRQSRFNDAVVMHPDVNAAQPTVRDTGIETTFLGALARRVTIGEAARMLSIDESRARRAVEFEMAA